MLQNAVVSRARLALAVLLVGIASGLGGAAMSWTLHTVQDLGFGDGAPHFADPYAVAAPWRRVLVLAATGVVTALLWWALRRRTPPVQSVTAMVAGDSDLRRRPPFRRGVLNAFAQVIAVGGGASIGREVAPRELGGLFAGRIGDALGLDSALRRTLVACGAAAGLSAVYHVPIAGAVFALEVLIGVLSLRNAALALSVSAIATVVARLTVSTAPFYRVEALPATLPILGGAVVVGLVLAVPAVWFRRAVARAEKHRLTGWRMLVGLPAAMLLTGGAALLWTPALGNGLVAAQTAYDASGASAAVLGATVVLLVVKVLLILLTLWSGAVGGTLTPGFAVGALSGLVLADCAQLLVPGTDLAALAVLGSAAFLAVSMDAPLTATMLTIGFTDQPASAFLPIVLAVAVAYGAGRAWTGRSRDRAAAGGA